MTRKITDEELRFLATPAQIEALDALKAWDGSVYWAAKELGIDESTFRNRLKDLRRKARREGAVLPAKPATRERPYVAPPESKIEEPPALKDHITRVLICPDIHLPYHDEKAWEVFLAVLHKWEPDRLVFLGDGVDFYRVSRFAKKRGRMPFDEELAIANREFDRVEHRVPEGCYVDYLEGNHENRLEAFLSTSAPELEGVLSAEQALRITERGWRWTPYKSHISIGKLHFAHDVGFCGVSCARQSVAAFGGSIIFGHSHQAQTHYMGTMNGDRHVGMTCGWLGDASKIDYAHQSKVAVSSQHGFGVAYVLPSGEHWSSFVPIVRGKAVVDGKLYVP